MWRRHRLEMRFVNDLCGGSPRSDKLVDDFVRLRAASESAHRRMAEAGVGPNSAPPQSLAAVAEERKDALDPVSEEEVMSRMWIGFQRLPQRVLRGPEFAGPTPESRPLAVRAGHLRAHLKACAESLAPIVKKGGVDGLEEIAMFKDKTCKVLYVDGDYSIDWSLIRSQATGDPVFQPSGYRDATMSVMTRQGARQCLKRVDYVEGAMLVFDLLYYPGGPITLDAIRACLDYGAVQGFGQDRSLQFGRYTYSLASEGRSSASC